MITNNKICKLSPSLKNLKNLVRLEIGNKFNYFRSLEFRSVIEEDCNVANGWKEKLLIIIYLCLILYNI